MIHELTGQLAYAYRAHERARVACLALRAEEMSNSRRLPPDHRPRMMAAEEHMRTTRNLLDAALLAVVEAVEESQR
jgi:hypothetical protein